MKKIINFIQKIKTMAKKKDSLANEISQDLKKIISNEETAAPLKSVKKTETKITEVSDELTQDTLSKAIAKAESEGKIWDEITQEERWAYIKEA